MALMPVDDALATILQGVTALPSESVSLLDADGRTLATAMAALLTQPPFDGSAMDGYALNTNGRGAHAGSKYTVIGTSAAGAGFHAAVGQGQCVRIFTGAPLPKRADTVVIQEDVSRDGDEIRIDETTALGRHIRPAGGDIRQGDKIAAKGDTLSPALIGLIAASGHGRVDVVRRPRVRIVMTGDELVPPGMRPAQDQIVASNGVMLAALLRGTGAEVSLSDIQPDKSDILNSHIEACLADKPDILVTVGGASVGDHDLVHEALAANAVDCRVHKIAMRPGKPLMSGRWTSGHGHVTHVVGLPGNPVSCFVTAHVFLRPLMALLQGAPHEQHIASYKLGAALSANGPRQHYLRAYISAHGGEPRVYPVDSQDSSLLSRLTKADGLIIQAPNAPALSKGSSVSVLHLKGFSD